MIEQFNRINRWVASEIVLVTDDAKQRLSVLKRMIELAHCCRDVQNLHAMYAIYVGLNMWAVQRLKSLWAVAAGQVAEAVRRARRAGESQVELGGDARAYCARSTRRSCRRST
jgi:hypothetical protein